MRSLTQNIVGVLYATILALTLQVLYDRFTRIQENVTTEAMLLSQVTRNLLSLFANEKDWVGKLLLLLLVYLSTCTKLRLIAPLTGNRIMSNGGKPSSNNALTDTGRGITQYYESGYIRQSFEHCVSVGIYLCCFFELCPV